MNARRPVIAILGLLVLGTGWYLFRPERLFVNKKVNEALAPVPVSAGMTTGGAATSDQVLVSGGFHSVAHATKGTATVHRLADGSRVLRFPAFDPSNGPDVQVYLVAAADASDNATVTKAGFVRLAALKGNEGDQNYDLPAELDLQKYRAVTIWCRRFGVNFATAP